MSKPKYAHLMEKLQSNKNNWEERFKVLTMISQILPTLTTEALPEIHKNFHLLSTELLDVRSKIARQASQIIIHLAQKFKTFLLVGDLMIKQSLKGLNSANNVLKECVYEAIQMIMVECKPQKSILRLIEEFKSKNNYVRQKVAEFLLIAVQEIDTTKYYQYLEQLIQSGLNDKIESVRKIMRKIYLTFQQYHPKVKSILLRLDPITTKLLQKEAKVINHNSYQKYSLISEQSDVNKQNQSNSYSRPKITQKSNLKSLRSERQSIISNCTNEYRKNTIPQKSSIFGSYILPVNLSKRQSVDRITPRVKSEKKEDIQFLVQKSTSHLWNTRLISLSKLIEILQSEEYQEILNQSRTKLIIGSIVKKLQDTHQKVVTKAVQGLTEIFPYYSNQCFVHCFEIVKRCIKGMTQKSKLIFQQLISILKAFDMSQVFASIIKLIQQSKNKQKLVCLDFMIEMLDYEHQLVQSKDVNHIFKLMTNLISQNKTLAIPALAIISILKTSHESRMWSCFINLSDAQLNRMIELASQIDPSLERIIMNFTKNNPRNNRATESIYSKEKQISLLNISELQAISRNPEFVNQYIDIIYEKVKYGQDPSLERLSAIIRSNQYLKQQSIYKLFEILHLSSSETVLLSINSILDLLAIESQDIFVRCVCEVIKLSTGIHLDMYLDKLHNVIRMASIQILQECVEQIVKVVVAHLDSQELQLRRACIMILAELNNRLKDLPFQNLKPHEKRLVLKYSKQIS